MDLRSGGLTRFTSHPSNDWQAAWWPDSASVVFASDRTGKSNVYRKAANGGGDDELLVQMPQGTFPKDVSPDGRFVLFILDNVPRGTNVWMMPLKGGSKPSPFLSSTGNHASFSPDGRWVVYESNESGTNEIYVRPFGSAGKQQVSRGGGRAPRWGRTGSELFYVNAARQLMRVPVTRGETLDTGAPETLFTACNAGDPNPLYEGRWYDVAPDGRFLMPCGIPRQAPSIVVNVGWSAAIATKK